MYRVIITSLHQIATEHNWKWFIVQFSAFLAALRKELSSLKTHPVAVFYDFTDGRIFSNQQQGVPDAKMAWLSIHLMDTDRQRILIPVLKWRQRLMVVWRICSSLRKVNPFFLFHLWNVFILFDCRRATNVLHPAKINYSACHKTLGGWFMTIVVLFF